MVSGSSGQNNPRSSGATYPRVPTWAVRRTVEPSRRLLIPKSAILTHHDGLGEKTRIFYIEVSLGLWSVGGSIAHAWLEIPMREPVLVHEVDSLKNLGRDLSALHFWKRFGEMLLKVAMFGILHSDEDAAFVLEPSE